MSPSIPGPHNERFLQIAESLKPELTQTTSKPLRAIEAVKDDKALMGWSAIPLDSNEEDRVLHKGDSVTFDFGTQIVSRLSENGDTAALIWPIDSLDRWTPSRIFRVRYRRSTDWRRTS